MAQIVKLDSGLLKPQDLWRIYTENGENEHQFDEDKFENG